MNYTTKCIINGNNKKNNILFLNKNYFNNIIKLKYIYQNIFKIKDYIKNK